MSGSNSSIALPGFGKSLPSSWLYVGHLILRLCKGLFVIWTPGLLSAIRLITERKGREREGEEEKEKEERGGEREEGERRRRRQGGKRGEEHVYINRPCRAFNSSPLAAGSQLQTNVLV